MNIEVTYTPTLCSSLKHFPIDQLPLALPNNATMKGCLMNIYADLTEVVYADPLL